MLDLDMGDVYDFLPLGAFFLWTFVITPLFPLEQRGIWGPLGMGLCVGVMVVIDEALMLMAAKYTHLLVICRPSNIALNLFFKTVETIEIQPGLFSSKFYLGEKVKHPYYQVMEYCVFKHWDILENRLEYTTRKVKFKGNEVTHSRSAVVTVYEETISDVDHLQPIPVFWLTEAPRDYYNPQDYFREVVAPQLEANGGQQMLQQLSPEERFDIRRLQKDNMELQGKAVEYERQALYWHNLAVKGEQIIKQLKNELHAVLGSEGDMQQAVVEMLLMWLGAHVDIREALKAAKGPFSWLNKRLIGVFAAVAVIALFILNPDPIMSWLVRKDIQALLFISLVIVGVIYYYTKRR